MITYSNANNDATWELIGLSTDEKPTENVPNGSMFYELDTGKVYAFDKQNEIWINQSALWG
ncbi:MAG: hypothetical protein IKY67_06320 [Paludibacteraceae bacterium]|nr:hypothetical protein [Paludibacteraceae bacterium]